MFDLTVFKYNRVNGKELNDLPGLFTAAPPRRAARGRERDLLVLMVQFDDHGSQVMGAQDDTLEQLSSLFFNTRGTVTTALKAVIDQLNDKLLARNLKSGKDNAPMIGLFLAAVVHDDTLLLAHSGPVHSFLINNENAQHFFDAAGSGRGLGVSRTPVVRYFRQTVQTGDLLLLSVRPPQNWTEKNLQGSQLLNSSNLRRRLLTQAGDDVCFSMLRIKDGAGAIELVNLNRPETAADESPSQPVTPSANPQAAPAADLPAAETASPAAAPAAPAKSPVFLSGKPMAVPRKPASEEKEAAQNPLQRLADRVQSAASKAAAPAPTAEVPHTAETVQPAAKSAGESPRVSHSHGERQGDPQAYPQFEENLRKRELDQKTRSMVGGLIAAVRSGRKKAGHAFSSLFHSVLPEHREKTSGVSTGTMIFIAIAVPLIVAAVGTTVYFQSGNSTERNSLLSQARTLYNQAETQSDATLKRVNLEAAQEAIEQAARYGNTQEVVDLSQLISDDIDALDGVRRLDMTLAAAISADGTNFTRVVASSTEDLYLLDANSGNVARLVYARPSYKIDNTFNCGPNVYGGIIVSKLVDITLAPVGNALGAVIMGVDSYGNILYCSTNPEETSADTLVAPDSGWGEITAINYQNGILDILDIGRNMVWRFGETEAGFNNAPRMFFSSDIPDVKSAIDISIYQDDLYMLDQSSELTLCTYNNISPLNTHCQSPYPFYFNQSGQPSQTLDRLNAKITQILTSEPPEPSIYFFAPDERAVYQFSLGMNFVRKIGPIESGGQDIASGSASAFTVTDARSLVLVIGNRIYTAEIPSY